jgi:hypothetical protein
MRKLAITFDALLSNTHAEIKKLTFRSAMFTVYRVQQDIARGPNLHSIMDLKFDEMDISDGAVASLFDNFAGLVYLEFKNCVFVQDGGVSNNINTIDLIIMGTSIGKLHLELSPAAADCSKDFFQFTLQKEFHKILLGR